MDLESLGGWAAGLVAALGGAFAGGRKSAAEDVKRLRIERDVERARVDDHRAALKSENLALRNANRRSAQTVAQLRKELRHYREKPTQDLDSRDITLETRPVVRPVAWDPNK